MNTRFGRWFGELAPEPLLNIMRGKHHQDGIRLRAYWATLSDNLPHRGNQ